MTIQDIFNLLANGEQVSLECKRAKAEVPKFVWETYSAFANTMGGYLLLGVDENRSEKDVRKRFHLTGVDDANKIVIDFWSTLHSAKVSENILTESDVEIVSVDGVKDVVKDGTKDGIKEISERQEIILELINHNDTITSSILTQKTGLSQRTLMRELASLYEKGFLTREGGRKSGKWVILKPFEK